MVTSTSHFYNIQTKLELNNQYECNVYDAILDRSNYRLKMLMKMLDESDYEMYKQKYFQDYFKLPEHLARNHGYTIKCYNWRKFFIIPYHRSRLKLEKVGQKTLFLNQKDEMEFTIDDKFNEDSQNEEQLKKRYPINNLLSAINDYLVRDKQNIQKYLVGLMTLMKRKQYHLKRYENENGLYTSSLRIKFNHMNPSFEDMTFMFEIDFCTSDYYLIEYIDFIIVQRVQNLSLAVNRKISYVKDKKEFYRGEYANIHDFIRDCLKLLNGIYSHYDIHLDLHCENVNDLLNVKDDRTMSYQKYNLEKDHYDYIEIPLPNS
ncbi:unnamed protein product [Didymodactylos carnosus]|uniref:Uncharacterized protein n=1 Tax=Didymodactylos carnosus TaxID=1234261 RepID=A0A8S2HP64_9BILA|nr:unnamed protein product [Didymodactylos carnosus]CAF3671442.1 unnamed protein product [Didymodactylos carnosus]